MSNPLFAVNEVVILQSESAPHLNGEYPVLDIVATSPAGVMLTTGKISHRPGYKLPITGPSGSNIWNEVALRKKQIPGTQSYQALLHELQSEVHL